MSNAIEVGQESYFGYARMHVDLDSHDAVGIAASNIDRIPNTILTLPWLDGHPGEAR